MAPARSSSAIESRPHKTTSRAGLSGPCSFDIHWRHRPGWPILSGVNTQADNWTLRPDADLRWRSWDGEYVVFHPASGDTHFLNPIAGEVLRYLEHRPAGVIELSHHLSDTFELPADEDLASQVRQCLAQFHDLGLIEPVATAESTDATERPEPA